MSTTSPVLRDKSFASKFVDLWWVRIPARLRGYSTILCAAWSDGVYLAAWPRAATALVWAVFLFGLIEGATQWSGIGLDGNGLVTGFHAESFAQMLLMMVLAVLLGSLSANLGLTLVIGFALADFFWTGPPYSPWQREIVGARFYGRIPQIAAYLVFFFLAVWPTVAGKCLVTSAHRRFRESSRWKTVLMAIVQSLFVFEWTYFAPMGVKQQWDCCSQTSPLDVRYFHDTTVPWLLGGTIVGVIARGVLADIAERSHPAPRGDPAANQDGAVARRMPQWAHAIIGAIVMSLLLLGFTVSAERIALVFLLIAAILLVRIYVFPKLSLWKAWSARVVRWPALIRLAAASLVTYCVCRLILLIPGLGASEGFTFGNFGPEIVAILIGYVAMLLLLPNGALAPEETGSVRAKASPRFPVPSGAVQAGIVVALVLLATKRAFAGLCLDTRCCFNGDNGQAGSAAAAGIPSAAATGAPDPCQKEKDAVESEKAKILGMQNIIDAEEQMLADLQQQVAPEIIELQSMAATALAEAAGNAFLSQMLANMTGQLSSLTMPAALMATGSADQFFSNPAFATAPAMSGEIGGALGAAQSGPYPFTFDFLTQLQLLLQQLSQAASLLDTVRNQKMDLAIMQATLAADEEALANCEASHAASKKG